MEDKKSKIKTLVIGLDGATWDLIKPWAEEGKLPTFKKLINEGVHGDLKSTILPWTIPAWNCMLTGKNPGKLGVFTFMQRKADSNEFHPYFLLDKSQKNSLIDILSENEKTVCSLNLPITHYPYKINGCMVGGWLSILDKEITYPENLKFELDKLTNGYEIDTYVNVDMVHGHQEIKNTEEFLKRLYQVTEKRAKTTEYLFNKYNWDFFIVVFTGPDRIQHRMWENKNEIEKYYQYIDNTIAKLLNKIDDDVVTIFVSDHGFGLYDKRFNINAWLIEKGFLQLKTSDRRAWIRKILMKLYLWNLGKIFLPDGLQNLVLTKTLNQPVVFEDAGIDWSRTMAYGYGNIGAIYINLKREKLKNEDYEKLRNKIINQLKELFENKKIPVNVFKREEIYSGKYIDEAPDLIALIDDNRCVISTKFGHGSIFSTVRGGDHRINGIFLISGPDIKKGDQIKDAEIIDIAPTILHIMGVHIPKDMDGRVLKEVFKENSKLAKKEIAYQEINEKERIKKIIKKFKLT